MPNPPSPDDTNAAAPSRDELRNELTRRGLPPAYIERLLSELDDHYVDLLEERSSTMSAARKLQFEESNAILQPSPAGRGQVESDTAAPSSAMSSAQQRLGEPTHLALFAAEQYQARSFWGRHPIVTFLLAPLPLLILCWIATMISMTFAGNGISYVCEHWLGISEANVKPGEHLLAQVGVIVAVSWLLIVMSPLVVAWLLCRIATRNALDWRWPTAACALLAFVAGCLSVSYQLAVQPHEGQFMIGLSFAQSAEWILTSFLPKFAIALGIGLLLVKRAQQQSQVAM